MAQHAMTAKPLTKCRITAVLRDEIRRKKNALTRSSQDDTSERLRDHVADAVVSAV